MRLSRTFRAPVPVNTRPCAKAARCELQILNPKDVVLERRVGSVGVLTLLSEHMKERRMSEGDEWRPQLEEMQRMGGTVQQEGIEVRQYEGRLKGEPSVGGNVFIKMYPKNIECDALAANELKVFAELQPPNTDRVCDQLSFLIGGYETEVAHCLVFRREGKRTTLGHYLQMAAKATQSGRVVGSADVWDALDSRRAEMKRQMFILRVFQQIAQGLEFMHRHYKLHQSLGPESITLAQYNETDISSLKVQIADLAFGVDASDEALSLSAGVTLEEIWNIANEREQQRQRLVSSQPLWTQARNAGAWSEHDKRNYGIADDMLSLGLLFLYTSLSAFSPSSGIDEPRLYRLVQSTFGLDLESFREYCCEDEHLGTSVAFLDMGDRAGWELIQAMIQTDWKSRPTAGSCLNHPFLNGSLFDSAL